VAADEPQETPAPIKGGRFRVPKIPGMAWCLTEDEPARRACGAGNHRVTMVATAEEDQDAHD
jgi:hypothetical protein